MGPDRAHAPALPSPGRAAGDRDSLAVRAVPLAVTATVRIIMACHRVTHWHCGLNPSHDTGTCRASQAPSTVLSASQLSSSCSRVQVVEGGGELG